MVELIPDSPFHAGEQAVQVRLGVREGIDPWARKVIRPTLPGEHRAFYEALPYVIAAARDATGRPWATILAGAPGFIRSPDSKTLAIEGTPVEGDTLSDSFRAGADVGLLGIELSTRRRNRVNGRVVASDENALAFEVDQSFGNCPQYISEREWQFVRTDGPAPERVRTSRLTDELTSRIRAADTFFIATGHRAEGENATFGMDASHRGGAPGFVEVVDDRTLVIPDYSGNNHFNTIGNLVVDPRAGLLFVDFETGGMLQLTGRAEIDWDSPEVDRFPGARRLIRFTLEEANSLEAALPLRWKRATESVRELRLIEKKRESADVVSLVLKGQTASRSRVFPPDSTCRSRSGTSLRRVSFVHGARDGAHHALAAEVRSLASEDDRVETHVAFSRPLATDLEGRDFDEVGRVDAALVRSIVSDLDAEFYLCGPVTFMAELQVGLEALGVPPDQIHSESFGPT
jgi:predicted pyridoxine 5'-phosphate oxidase superfamily flavin-nucleotide-binding protein